MAADNNQNKWLYAILSIAIFFIGTVLGAIILNVVFLIIDYNYDWDNDKANSIIAIPFGLLADYLFYYILNKKWQIAIEVNDDIDDIGKSY